MSQTVTELQIEDIQIGQGDAAQDGDFIRVHYTGKLSDGKVFDSSLDRYDPLEFQLGAGEVIKGWDQGVLGMKVGGKRNLVIPPKLGYGNRDMGVIPPKSTLHFEVELVEIVKF